jgi:hypothetical protein
MNMIRSSSLYLKGLVATGEQDQEQGPWFTARDLGDTSVANNICFMRKRRTQQNRNPNESEAANYRVLGIIHPGHAPYWASTQYMAQWMSQHPGH